jgi:amino acid transporter
MTNLVCLYLQLAVLAVFVIATLGVIWQGKIHFGLDPLVGADGFSLQRIFSAIPIAALSYIGFDAMSTLNEEAQGGGQTIAKATMIVLVAVAVLFVLQVYLAALLVPVGTQFTGESLETAFYDVAVTAAGHWFKVVITVTSAVIAMLANAIVSQATTSRLIFSMARDRQLPRFLAAVDARRKIPQRAILLVALLSTTLGIVAVNKADLVTSLVTFGSLTSYLLLHVAVIRHFALGSGRGAVFKHWISPILGLIILVYALWNASVEAKTLAGIWLALGILGRRLSRRVSPAALSSAAAAVKP